MLELMQKVHNLIGSTAAIKELEKKDHARLLIISDSHGHSNTFINIVKHFGPSCDAVIFCGDGIKDLAELLEQANVNEELRKIIPPVIAFARGNGDPSVYPVSFDIGFANPEAEGMRKGSLLVPLEQTLTVNGHNCMVTHGHYHGVDFGLNDYVYSLKLNDCTIGFYGHTHVASQELLDGYKFINPGSCTRPRGGQPSCCAILTVEKEFTDVNFLKIISPLGSNPDFESIRL